MGMTLSSLTGSVPSPSFKAGKPAFKKRRQVAEAIAKTNPTMPMSNKMAIATAQTKKIFKKK